MFNFAADSDIYQWVSSGDAHKQPVPWTEASWPEGEDRRKERWRETEREETEHHGFLIERQRFHEKHRIFNLAQTIVSTSTHCQSLL